METESWSNHQTYLVKLWIDNKEEHSKAVSELVDSINSIPATTEHGGITYTVNKVTLLADNLEVYVNDYMIPQTYFTEGGLASDLLMSGLADVDWHEIAEQLLGVDENDYIR